MRGRDVTRAAVATLTPPGAAVAGFLRGHDGLGQAQMPAE